MTHIHPEAAEYAAHQDELLDAAGVTVDCKACDGYGRTMEMHCYGGPPCEEWRDCPECEGTGQVRA